MVVTNRCKPAYGLFSIDDYRRLIGMLRPRSLLEVMDGIAGDTGDIDFEPPRIDGPPTRSAMTARHQIPFAPAL